MFPKNILHITTRSEFREWLVQNHATETECWLSVKRGKTPPADMLWYIDAVEEALCFGWIASTVKRVDGVPLQRFSPRSRNSRWTEQDKERVRRLEALGLMTESGRAACPDLAATFVIMPEVHRQRVKWLGITFTVMFILPFAVAKLASECAGMALCMMLFLVLNPIYSVVLGVVAGRSVKAFWNLPLVSAVAFLAGTWLFFDMHEPCFWAYADVYLVMGYAAMGITHYMIKKQERGMPR